MQVPQKVRELFMQMPVNQMFLLHTYENQLAFHEGQIRKQ